MYTADLTSMMDVAGNLMSLTEAFFDRFFFPREKLIVSISLLKSERERGGEGERWWEGERDGERDHTTSLMGWLGNRLPLPQALAGIQWNLKMQTCLGPLICVLIIEVVLFEGLINVLKGLLGLVQVSWLTRLSSYRGVHIYRFTVYISMFCYHCNIW